MPKSKYKWVLRIINANDMKEGQNNIKDIPVSDDLTNDDSMVNIYYSKFESKRIAIMDLYSQAWIEQWCSYGSSSEFMSYHSYMKKGGK